MLRRSSVQASTSLWLLTHGEYCLVWFVGVMLWLWTSATSNYCIFNHACLNSPLLYSLSLLPMGITPAEKSLFFWDWDASLMQQIPHSLPIYLVPFQSISHVCPNLILSGIGVIMIGVPFSPSMSYFNCFNNFSTFSIQSKKTCI